MAARIINYVTILIFSFVAYGVFVIKDKVSTLNVHLAEVIRQIKHERNNIHTLKAETAYLSSPSFLRDIVQNHFKLENIKTNQMINDPLDDKVDELINAKIATANISSRVSRVKWRYKKSHDKYLKTVSNQR